MSKLIHGIHHVAINCRNYEHFQETIAFYHKLLGLDIARSWGEGDTSAIMLDTGAGLLEIFAAGGEEPKEGSLRHIALATTDVDTCIHLVQDAGYEVTVEPKDLCIPSEVPYPVRIAFCKGPVGETVEFFCVK